MTFSMRKVVFASLALTPALAVPTFVLAQDFSLDSNYGEIELSSNFSPDPHILELIAGGSNSASSVNSSCNGNVSDAPDLRVKYTPGQYVLSFLVESDVDTTILVNTPTGDWICNDDNEFLEGGNAGIMFNSPEEGRYDIWVGVYSTDDLYAEAKLVVSEATEARWGELDLGLDQTSSSISNSNNPVYGTIKLTNNFSPDPHRLDLIAGGDTDASTMNSDCNGFVGTQPDYRLEYIAGEYVLSFIVSSEIDTTLIIRDPKGTFHCNDDSEFLSSNNPGIMIGRPLTGAFDIWVGTFSNSNTGDEAQLIITEASTDNWAPLIPGTQITPETQQRTAASNPPASTSQEPEPEAQSGQVQYRSKN